MPLPFEANTQLAEAEHSEARLWRYLPDGKLGPTFGNGVIVETDFGLPARPNSKG